MLGFQSSLADPDVWLKASIKSNGTKVYDYILVYVDDLLIIFKNPDKYMKQIQEKYRVKPESIGPPSIYLGSHITKSESRLPGHQCWVASAEQYIIEAVKNVKKKMKEDGFEFDRKLSSTTYSPKQPFSSAKYRPELDGTAECDAKQHNYFQNLIGVLRWAVQLGRIDINYEVSVLSQYLASPRIGHLHQMLHISKYLDLHRSNALAFDPTPIDIIRESDNGLTSPNARADQMREFYPDAEEAIPTNAPPPRGEAVRINTFCDSDHAANQVTHKSHSGILHFMNCSSPINWFSKRQNSVETSTFSSEFVALRIAVEQITAIHYKLKMFGVPITGPACIFCDNEAVYKKNTAFPDSRLNKKHNSVAYHHGRCGVAAKTCTVYKEGTETNLADLLTKSTHSPARRKFLRSAIMCEVKINCSNPSGNSAS